MIGLQAGSLLSATTIRLPTFQHEGGLPRLCAMKGAESGFAAFPEIKRCWRERVACKDASPCLTSTSEDDQFRTSGRGNLLMTPETPLWRWLRRQMMTFEPRTGVAIAMSEATKGAKLPVL